MSVPRLRRSLIADKIPTIAVMVKQKKMILLFNASHRSDNAKSCAPDMFCDKVNVMASVLSRGKVSVRTAMPLMQNNSCTSIGAHGGYFMELAEKGRFLSFPYPSKGFPPQLGESILTTSKPDAKKAISLKQTVDMVERGQSILLVFGIGPHGVPKSAASIPRYNLEITGGNYSLETCTAMGAVAGALHALLDQ